MTVSDLKNPQSALDVDLRLNCGLFAGNFAMRADISAISSRFRRMNGLLSIFKIAAIAALCSSPVAAAQNVKTTFAWLAAGQPGVLYEPLKPAQRTRITVFAMHDTADLLGPNPANPCAQLAARGYRVLCANSTTSKSGFFSDKDIDKVVLNVKAGLQYLRARSDTGKIVLFGHSGGGAMMAAYQNIAENGVKACQGPEKLIKCPDSLADMPAADGIMLIDAVIGGPAATLISIDPAVVDEDEGRVLNPQLDMYNPANGFNPKGSTYSPEFRARFFAAQADRMNRLVVKAQDRLKVIEAGQGRFSDDEPFIVPGAAGVQNKLNAQDLGLMAHTRGTWPLLHAGGTVTNEVVRSVRMPRGTATPTPSLARGATTTTVRRFLSSWGMRVNADYRYDASSLVGMDHKSSYADTINSVGGIARPVLLLGMTGSYEYFFSELIHEHARSSDKTLAYVDGALHGFTPCTDCAVAHGKPANYYGDTVKTMYDYIAGWLSKPGRF